ncbi:MAG TPA: hypothetical protein VFQ61_05535 [Polyangiaceae bacterium]|nr:hypothetical protein [Polyangiaceae bacterium]
MRVLRINLVSAALTFCMGASLVVGCGDDDDGPVGQGGTSGGTKASGGASSKGGGGSGGGSTGGSKASGGSNARGGRTSTSSPEGGADPIGSGGSTEPPQSEGGATSSEGGAVNGGSGGYGGDGEGGSSGGAPEPERAMIAQLKSSVVTQVNDLRGLAFAKSGKLYASGHIGADANVDRQIAVVRFSVDGSLDESFGTGGVLSLNLVPRVTDTTVEPAVVSNDGNEQSLGIVELENGDLIVQANLRDASGKGQDVALLRLDSSGQRVESFGQDGLLRLDFGWTPEDAANWTGTTGPSDDSWGIARDASSGVEKIVVFGAGPAKKGAVTGEPATQRTDNDRYIARVLASTGELDPAFNGGSVFTLNTGGTFADGARRGIVEPDGAIVSSGYTNYGDGLGNHFVVIRLLPNGTPDPNFGFGIGAPGVARGNPFLDDGGIAECYNVTRQSNGRYVTTGYGRATAVNTSSSFGWSTTQSVDLVSFGFMPSGLDRSFGRQGTLAIQSEEYGLGNTEDRGRDVIALADDRLVYVGRFGPNPAIFVTLPDGQLDESVGVGGRLVYPPLGETSQVATSHFYRVVASPDGKRIAATTNNHPDGVLLALLGVDVP